MLLRQNAKKTKSELSLLITDEIDGHELNYVTMSLIIVRKVTYFNKNGSGIMIDYTATVIKNNELDKN